MHVLVTGASGYTGSRLVKALREQGHSVHALVHTPAKAAALRQPGTRVTIGDLTQPASIAGIAAGAEVIYHLAGTLGGEAELRRMVLEGTANLIRQCQAAAQGTRLRAFVFSGNAAVYGDGAGALLDEESACQPSSPLGRINLAVEELLAHARADFGLPAIVVRIGAIYGPTRLSSTTLSAGSFRIIGSGRNHSSRIHINDLIAILVALLHGAPRPLYCAADAEPSPVVEYYRALAALLGAAPPPHIPVWSARARATLRSLAAAATGRRAGAEASVIDLFTADQRLDNSRLLRDLRLSLRYPSYRSGLAAALAGETAGLSSSQVLAGSGARRLDQK